MEECGRIEGQWREVESGESSRGWRGGEGVEGKGGVVIVTRGEVIIGF